MIRQVTSFVASFRDGIAPMNFAVEWRRAFDTKLPLQQYGHRNLKGFLANIPSIVRSGSGTSLVFKMAPASCAVDSEVSAAGPGACPELKPAAEGCLPESS